MKKKLQVSCYVIQLLHTYQGYIKDIYPRIYIKKIIFYFISMPEMWNQILLLRATSTITIKQLLL